MHPEKKIIAKFIREVRADLELTQRELAARIPQCSRDKIANYETERALPPANIILCVIALGKQVGRDIFESLNQEKSVV